MTPTAIRTVAALSDIHGVAPALDAVLAEPDVMAADRIVLAGDIAVGPQPVDVLDRLVGLGDRIVWVRGNADRELVALARGGDTAIPDPIAPWAAQQLAERLVCGHTHMPYQRLAHRRLSVNPGSVGMPCGCKGAHWALLRDGVAQLRTTTFDAEAACRAIVDAGYPDAASWVDFFLRSPAGDAEALATFAPRDGRGEVVVR